MALPALQCWRARRPDTRISVLAKPVLADFWKSFSWVDQVFPMPGGTRGMPSVAGRLAGEHFDGAYILPNSFRSALLPWMARIPGRYGFSGHWRRLLLSGVRRHRSPEGRRHQAREYFSILGLEQPPTVPAPVFPVKDGELPEVAGHFGLSPLRPVLAVLPGAARGAAKRWPPDLLVAALQRITRQLPEIQVCLLGSGTETAICAGIARELVPVADLSGRTSLRQLALLLALSDAALCNDSGGMHLAAAVATPTVAVFGLTDPEVTGPLGSGHRILCAPGSGRVARRIARNSDAALSALRRITPDAVAGNVLELLAGCGRKDGGVNGGA